MKVTLLNAKQVGLHLERLMQQTTKFYWAVAWATDIELAARLIGHHKKISKVVIGTDFAQTSPSVLRQLMLVPNARVMISEGGVTFHPKVYCFEHGTTITAIVGSSNFTQGGTSRNDEAALLIEGDVNDEVLDNLVGEVSHWWTRGKPITDRFLLAYDIRWKANQRYRKAIKKPLRVYQPSAKATHSNLIGQPWDEFLKEVNDSSNHSLDGRIAVLRAARDLFESNASFDQLTQLQRRAIAGVAGIKELSNSSIGTLNWGWFGSMKGAGSFQNRINDNDAHLAAALAQIPLAGDISETQYQQFAAEFDLAFKSATRKGGVATASRLLAMKRPDFFVCVDSKNAVGLGADVGFTSSTLTLANYWERVVAPITEAKWWNSERPDGDDGKVWDSRAAMLDAIYYEPK